MSRRFGLGIVGAGMAARPHVLALRDLSDRVDVRGIHTRSPVGRDALSQMSGFPAVESFDALLDDPELEAILLLTPPNARAELVARAAKAGKHVLMEKPIERTTAAARDIVETCDREGIRHGVIFQHRFRPSSIAMADLIAAGALGAMRSVFVVVPWWRPPSYYEEPGRGTLSRDGGGVLMTQAIHVLDLMLSLTGPVRDVQAMAGTTMHRMETEDFVAGGLRFESGALGSVMATVTSFPGEQEYITFNFENATATLAGGMLDVHWHDGRHERLGEKVNTGGGGTDPMDFPYAWHQAQIEDFIDAVRSGRDPVSNGRTALQVHCLIDALLASSREGKTVPVVSV